MSLSIKVPVPINSMLELIAEKLNTSRFVMAGEVIEDYVLTIFNGLENQELRDKLVVQADKDTTAYLLKKGIKAQGACVVCGAADEDFTWRLREAGRKASNSSEVA